jgi:hypothetical protein
MALNSSMSWALVGLVHLFPCTKSFFNLVVVLNLAVWSRRGFCCVRYCRGRNLIPLSKKSDPFLHVDGPLVHFTQIFISCDISVINWSCFYRLGRKTEWQ